MKDMALADALDVAGWPKALLAPEKQATLLQDTEARAAARHRRAARHRLRAADQPPRPQAFACIHISSRLGIGGMQAHDLLQDLSKAVTAEQTRQRV